MELLKYLNCTTTHDSRKCIDLFGIGAATGAVGNFISSILTNNTNKKISRENNELAYKMFTEGNEFNRAEREAAMGYNSAERMAAQAYNTKERLAAQDYNTQMWLKQAAYNTPAAQAVRLRAAGLNPSNLIDEGGSVGSVQSSPASVSPASISGASSAGIPGLSTPQLEAPRFTGISDMLDAMSKNEEIKGQRTDNETRDLRNKAEIEKLIAEKEKTLQDSKLSKKERERINYEIVGLKIQNARADFARQHDQIVESRTQQMFENQMRALEDAHDRHLLDMATQKLMNQLAIKRDSRDAVKLQADIQKIGAEINHMKHQNGLIDAQRINESLKSKGINLDNVAKELNNAHQRMQNDSDSLDFSRKSDVQERRENAPMFRFGDDVIYWLMDQLGTPIKGALK